MLLSLLAFAYGTIDIWIAPRTDGLSGTGTSLDPYDASTQDKFDSLMVAFCSSGATDITFHLMPGTYFTLGSYDNYGFDHWGCLSNWKFRGSGSDSTVVKLDGYRYLGANKGASNCVFVQFPWFRTGIEFSDLTIDCSWLDFGSILTAPFTVPADGQNVLLTIANSDWAVAGRYAYLQRKDTFQVIGFFEVISVPDKTHVLLKNLHGSTADATRDRNADINKPQGTLVSGPAYVGPAVNTCGIAGGARGCIVERVHVVNSGTPMYEGPIGIYLVHINNDPATDPFKVGDGNIIRNCVVENLWGQYGWGICVVSNNPDTGNVGTFITCLVEGNTVRSNGMHQGLSSWGTANSIWRDNTVTNCGVGWFADVGYNQDAQITNNSFNLNGTGIFFGGGYVDGWLRFTVANNKILVPQFGQGIFTNGQVKQCVFSGNQILAASGTTSGFGFNINPYYSSGNKFSNNTVSAVLVNQIPASVKRSGTK